MPSLLEGPDTVTPTGDDSSLARESGRQLAKYLDRQKSTVRVAVQENGTADESVVVPMSAFRLLTDILSAMGRGDALAVVPLTADVSTQEAADVLNVSRPYLEQLLVAGAVPHHTVGPHRRVRVADLMAYKRASDADRRAALDDLAAEGQSLNLG